MYRTVVMGGRPMVSWETEKTAEKMSMKWMGGDLGDNDYVHILIEVMTS